MAENSAQHKVAYVRTDTDTGTDTSDLPTKTANVEHQRLDLRVG
jgi:hypothetical protein